jgi:hypothetical protein
MDGARASRELNFCTSLFCDISVNRPYLPDPNSDWSDSWCVGKKTWSSTNYFLTWKSSSNSWLVKIRLQVTGYAIVLLNASNSSPTLLSTFFHVDLHSKSSRLSLNQLQIHQLRAIDTYKSKHTKTSKIALKTIKFN